jgi:bile acid:Na+ symporter, BASS family
LKRRRIDEFSVKETAFVLQLPTKLLAWIGRYGTEGFALSIFVGLALPQFAAAARPLLAVTIFVFVMLTFARADAGAVKALLKAPRRLIIACFWLILAPALAITGILSVVGRQSLDPGLVLGLAVMGAAPPIMSGPAVAMLLGLNPTLIIAAVMASTLAAPLFSPVLINLIAGVAVPLDLGILMQRLLLLIGGAVVGAFILRKTMGTERIAANKETFDGIGVLMYFLFAIAAMDGVMAAALTNTFQTFQFLGVAYLLSFLGFAAAWLALIRLPEAERFVLGYGTLQRNMGLLIAALGAATPKTTFLYFALAQFPIYTMPLIMRSVAGRLREGADPARGP